MKTESKAKVGRREFLRVLGAGAGVAAAAAGPLATSARADTETNDEKRKSRYKETDHVKKFYSREPVPDEMKEAPVLIKRTERQARRGTLAAAFASHSGGALDRRSFLRRSGLAVGGLAAVGALPLASVRKADAAAGSQAGVAMTIRKNICTHCSVGCTVIGEVQNGVWVGQEPGWDLPISRGSHCAKGAATRELVHGDRRLRYPMKLVNGQWNRISWDVAINEIGDKLMEIRGKSGADFGLLAGLSQVHQRRRLSQPQVRRVLGHQQLGPPGPHLPLHHRRRRSQHLGLRRDDQQLHRHPQHQDDRLHGLQRRRGSPGVAAAHPGRQGSSTAPR